jgi:hypothetical protein
VLKHSYAVKAWHNNAKYQIQRNTIMSIGGGKSSGSSSPTLSPAQEKYVNAQTDFYTNTLQPVYKDIVGGAKNIYEQNLPGQLRAGQNLAGTAGQVQQTLGETGESALRTGVSGLEGLFGKDYEQQQIQAALGPAQAQYMQNVANQGANFGGAGQLGSARQALAGQQMAGANAGQQAALAAQIANQVAQQRQGASTSLMNYGAQALPGTLAAANQIVNASNIPQSAYANFASVPFGTPAASYNNMGPTGTNTSSSNKSASLRPSF